jgi:hypothetical protein
VNGLFRVSQDSAPISQGQTADVKKCEAAAEPNSWSCIPKTANAKIEFLIAAVADPSQTHLALNTDRGLESLMWAIGDAGYNFERYWLPWPIRREIDPASVADQQCLARLKQRREEEPGILIFRRNPSAGHEEAIRQFLFVFIAGETPTSGIQKGALSKAVEYIGSLTASGQSKEIRILGPNFSGSLEPLKTDLDVLSVRYPAVRFHIVSGTASNYDAIHEFENPLPLHTKYESAVENDFRAARLFFNYIDSQSRSVKFSPFPESGEIAILSEDETVYGSGDIRRSVDESIPWNELSHDWLMLRYPREIARLRNAYSAETTLPSQSKPETPAQSGLPLSLRDSPAGATIDPHTDSISTFSEQQSPASQQAVLLTIAATLRRERAAYAGIVATDVLDSLFLARFLRISDPDVRIFTLDADLLFLRESEEAPMIGLLSVTNYPLFSRNQHWTQLQLKESMPRRIPFSSRFSEGIYNACRRLIPPVDSPGTGERYLEYQRPFDGRHNEPPLWLTVLGRDGYWPVAVLDETNPKDQSTLTDFAALDKQEGFNQPLATTALEPLHPEPPSRSWSLFFVLACVFCFLHIIFVVHLLNRPDSPDYFPPLWVNGLRRLFSAYPEGQPSDEERPFLLSATVSLFTSLSVFSMPLCRFLAFDWAQRYFALSCLCLIGLLILSVWLTIGKLPYPRITVITWLLALSFPSIWCYLILRDEYHAGIFLAYRALYLGNGVSPGIPIALLATAFYGWAWVHLKQEAVSAKRQNAQNNNEFGYLENFQRLMFKTDESVAKIMQHGISLPALALIALWFLILWPFKSVRTFESYWYDILYNFVLVVLYWSIALVWVQFMRCWRRFRELLEALERHPIRGAFSRLPKEISWIPLVSTSPFRNLFVSSRTCDCLRALLACLEESHLFPPLRSALDTHYAAAAGAYSKLEKNIAEGKDINPDDYGTLQTALDTAAHDIVDNLQGGIWKQGGSESLAQAEKEPKPPKRKLTPEEKITVLEEEFIALRFLIFIRYVIRQLRNWVGFIVAGFIVSIVSLNSYPFQAHRWIGLASIIMLLGFGSGVAFVFAQMDKDAILSRITDTKQNEIGKIFFFRLIQYGSLPLLTVLAAQFPAVGRALFSWVQPALEALK